MNQHRLRLSRPISRKSLKLRRNRIENIPLLIHQFDRRQFALNHNFRSIIRIRFIAAQVPQFRNLFDGLFQLLQLDPAEVPVQHFGQYFVELQNALPLVQFTDHIPHLFHGLFAIQHICNWSVFFRALCRRVQLRFFLMAQLPHLELPDFLACRSQHLIRARRSREVIVLAQRRLPAMLRDELRLRFLDLLPPLGKPFHHVSRNARQIVPDDIAFPVPRFDRFVTQFTAPCRHLVVIDLAHVTDRTAHLQRFERLVPAVTRPRHIADHVVRMQLRVKRAARIVHELRVNQLPGRFVIVGPNVLAITHPNRRQPFQFRHRNPNRFPMRLDQPFVEHRHHRNRLRSRHLKVKEPRTAGHILLRQLAQRFRIHIPLKQTELLARHNLIPQTKRIRKLSPPISPNFLMLRIIIV